MRIWLDDLERYLGADGLTAHQVRKILGNRSDGSRLILATIRAQERARYGGLGADDGGPTGGDQRVGRGVLNLAHEIRLDRRWSSDEVERARAVDDIRIVDAVGHANRYGIAEFLAAGPQLLGAWRDAWAPEGRHTRGAALVAAAVDARCAGWSRPLPLTLLKRLHEHYLSARGGPALRPEPWEDALAWAMTPLYATSSLLTPAGTADEMVLVFDYLPDAVDADPTSGAILLETWTVLIAEADASTCVDIGWEAYVRRELEIAATAFRRSADLGAIIGAVGLARILAEDRDPLRATEVLRSALASAPHDADPEELLDLRGALSWWSGQSGNLAEALELAEAEYEALRLSHGDTHERTLSSALGVARWMGHAGRPAEALQKARETYGQCRTSLGPDHRLTLGGRFEVAAWTKSTGDLAEAQRLWTELDVDATHILGEFDRLTNDARWNRAGVTLLNGDIESALRLFDSVVDGRTHIYGADHPWTLTGRLQRAGKTGRLSGALILAQTITVDCRRALGEDHLLTLCSRFQTALWTACLGRTSEATAQFLALLNDVEAALGSDHQLTQACREQLNGRVGDPARYYLPPTW